MMFQWFFFKIDERILYKGLCPKTQCIYKILLHTHYNNRFYYKKLPCMAKDVQGFLPACYRVLQEGIAKSCYSSLLSLRLPVASSCCCYCCRIQQLKL